MTGKTRESGENLSAQRSEPINSTHAVMMAYQGNEPSQITELKGECSHHHPNTAPPNKEEIKGLK